MGRFAGLGADSQAAVRPLGLGALLRFDFTAPLTEQDERIAGERARALRVAAPMVAGFHLLWAAVAASFLASTRGTGTLLPILLPLGLALLLDVALCVLLARREASPHISVRLTAAETLAGGALWAVATGMAVAGGPVPPLAAAALVAGVAVPVAAYFLIPGLLLASCATTLGSIFLIKGTDPILGIAIAICAYLVGLGLMRARDLILATHQKLAAEGEAKKARRFVADFEASGRGWFWETNGDGLLAYVSEQFARRLGASAEALAGRRFEELLVVEALEGADESKATLGFHLNARFPFTDLVVGAEGSDACWSLSGNPVFDAYGRFMGFRGLGTNISEERRREVEVGKRARYDSLTGLPNRATMRNMLDEALANAAARQRGCGLMMIDLDRFKPVNDTLGHPVGDKLLKDVSRRLAGTLGSEGRVGRIGGDEFEAILPGVAEEGRLAALAESLIAEMCRPFEIEGHEIRIGGSVGIAVARPGKAYAEALIKEADLALYAAKADGRGTFRFFSPDMHQQAADRQVLEADLRSALARDQLRLLFQPIVDSVSEEIVGFEALLRWQHPTRGLLAAAEMVPMAEECGLMPAIGNWVLRTACAEAAKWPAHVRIAVNLSPAQLRDAALPGTVTGALASVGLDPGRLELEITEAVFLADAGPCGAMLDRLNALGVRLALDNFGTGRSGLGHLRSAPFDKIKIDRSFVRGAAGAGGRDAAIVRAIVVLAESLRMDTTAEGAETLEELALIRRLGCSQVQGFLFGKPVPAAEARAAAEESRPSSKVVGFSRPPRHRMIRVGTLKWDEESCPARLRNISADGAMVECGRAMAPETRVRLDLDEAGFIDADVRWCQAGQIGLHFERPFDLRRLARPRKAAGLKMLTPAYLEPEPRPAQSPLGRKPARRR